LRRQNFQRREPFAHRVEMFFAGRIEQQRAEPRMSGDGREIAVAEMLALNQARLVVNPDSRRLSSVPWLKVSPITGRPRQYSSHASSVLEAFRWKTERSAAFAPGKIMVSCGSHSSVDLHRGKSAGSDEPAGRCCDRTCWRRAW
jgi:hypothetical protein